MQFCGDLHLFILPHWYVGAEIVLRAARTTINHTPHGPINSGRPPRRSIVALSHSANSYLLLLGVTIYILPTGIPYCPQRTMKMSPYYIPYYIPAMCTNDTFNVYFCAHLQNRVVDFCSFAGPFTLIYTCVIRWFTRKKRQSSRPPFLLSCPRGLNSWVL